MKRKGQISIYKIIYLSHEQQTERDRQADRGGWGESQREQNAYWSNNFAVD